MNAVYESVNFCNFLGDSGLELLRSFTSVRIGRLIIVYLDYLQLAIRKFLNWLLTPVRF